MLFPLLIYFALLICLTWMDIRHDRLPDRLTIPGTVAGVFLSALFPSLQSRSDPVSGAAMSLLGGVCGFAVGWLTVEIGKLIWGRKTMHFEEEREFLISVEGNAASLSIGDQ
jgi:leader peptidase (prepilin peptidase)/N-methyltransferase